ncbi:MAG: universal stress protein [Archaeoglobaceae archaeon]
MVSIRKMLYPTDFSPYSKVVLNFLNDLREAGIEEVGVLFVVNTSKLSTVSGGFDIGRYIELEEKRAEEEMPEILSLIESEGMKAKVHKPYPSGNPTVEITKIANSYDFIALGARGRGIFKEILLGSVSEGVVRKSNVPVYVFKSKVEENELGVKCYKPCEKLFERILVAYDFSNHSKLCLDYASTIAQKVGSELVILHADEDDACKVDDLQSVEKELKDSNLNFRTLKTCGSPVKVILQKQKELKASTIFIGSRGLGLGKALILGSVSDPVIRMSEVPVFVCKGEKR